MKITITRPSEIEVSHVLIDVPVSYGTEEIPDNFPLRVADRWRAKIHLETGCIDGWPQGVPAELFLTVRDSGAYSLLAPDGSEIVKRESYVPNRVIPGDYGDTIQFKVASNGMIEGWRQPTQRDFEAFFSDEEE